MILIPTKAHHIRTLVANLRPEDQYELDLCLKDSGLSRCDVVMEMWQDCVMSQAILTDDGTIAGVWGVYPCPGEPDIGLIWMLGTPALPRVTHAFLRACPQVIKRAHGKFPSLACTAWRGNSLHLKWLEWCGFTAHDNGHDFIGFVHVRSSSNPAGSDGRLGGGIDGGRGCPTQPAEQVD